MPSQFATLSISNRRVERTERYATTHQVISQPEREQPRATTRDAARRHQVPSARASSRPERCLDYMGSGRSAKTKLW